MKQLFLIGVCCILVATSRAQEVNYAKATEWRIYKVKSREAFVYPSDSLAMVRQRALNDDSVQLLISEAQPIPEAAAPLWMGCYLASYKGFDGRLRRVVVSTYGGFFYDVAASRYFRVSDEKQTVWLNFWADYASQL